MKIHEKIHAALWFLALCLAIYLTGVLYVALYHWLILPFDINSHSQFFFMVMGFVLHLYTSIFLSVIYFKHFDFVIK